ncbi:hypothetical protein E1A91_A11G210600v1 [Gossypium mustelinum]|uniref:Uncharacterized protein n=1 Tax=Gossypium mustelinum TaxID=34275 RepID=A0A5D2X9U0_GOSMU|nr:hypothetical protein E1A91_A11G210600v1 [Gossypium mustelinum]
MNLGPPEPLNQTLSTLGFLRRCFNRILKDPSAFTPEKWRLKRSMPNTGSIDVDVRRCTAVRRRWLGMRCYGANSFRNP